MKSEDDIRNCTTDGIPNEAIIKTQYDIGYRDAASILKSERQALIDNVLDMRYGQSRHAILGAIDRAIEEIEKSDNHK